MIDFYIIMTIVDLHFPLIEYTFSANEPLSFICAKYYSRSTVPLLQWQCCYDHAKTEAFCQKSRDYIKSRLLVFEVGVFMSI